MQQTHIKDIYIIWDLFSFCVSECLFECASRVCSAPEAKREMDARGMQLLMALGLQVGARNQALALRKKSQCS